MDRNGSNGKKLKMIFIFFRLNCFVSPHHKKKQARRRILNKFCEIHLLKWVVKILQYDAFVRPFDYPFHSSTPFTRNNDTMCDVHSQTHSVQFHKDEMECFFFVFSLHLLLSVFLSFLLIFLDFIFVGSSGFPPVFACVECAVHYQYRRDG